ncbi:MAG: helix-turn-helix domain-containing protein [Edaphobacter sp.]
MQIPETPLRFCTAPATVPGLTWAYGSLRNTSAFVSRRIVEVQMMTQSETEAFVTPEEAATFLHYSPVTVKRLAREGKIPAHSITNGVRKRWRFLISELADRMRTEVSLTASSAPLKRGGSGK